MKRLTLKLSDELHSHFKAICVLQDKNMTEVVKGFIGEYVARQAKSKTISTLQQELLRNPKKLQGYLRHTAPSPSLGIEKKKK